MKNITVFLGSKTPKNPVYIESVKQLAQAIAQNNHTLIYGGAKVGTMGVLADTALNNGGKVIGIMPKVLTDKEVLHTNLTETIVVKDMHERKSKLQEIGDIFVTMPGGCGTMEEIFEVITWNQIGIHDKPYCFINIDGFYDGIRMYLTKANELGFISDQDLEKIHFFDSIQSFIKSDLFK